MDFEPFPVGGYRYVTLIVMTAHTPSIRDHVEVKSHPTVVRLADLEAEDAAWLSESFVLTQEIGDHLRALRR